MALLIWIGAPPAAVATPGMPSMVNAMVWPTPLVRNGSKISVLRNVAESSRPRRTSPKLPIRLTVERRLKVSPPPVPLPPPTSGSMPASSQKPAFSPPPGLPCRENRGG